MTKYISILGPPGSGKGTLASYLSRYFGISTLSTGDLVRDEIKNNTSLGLIMAPYIKRGDLVPDELIINLFNQIISNSKYLDGFISDGYPRTLIQAKSFNTILSNQKHSQHYILLLDISVDFLLDRILGRLICTQCKRIFHMVQFPPSEKNKCDDCEGEIISRSDDTETIILNRNKVYLDLISPVINFYEDQLIHLNANQAPSDVFAEFKAKINV